MQVQLIFLWIYLAMIAMSFWESEVEGRKAWDRGKLGWKINLGKYCLPAYHFFVFWVMWPLLLTLPLVVYGWNLRLLGILISAYFSGMIIEDFMWYVVNPAIKFSESFNSKFANYYPWLKFGKLEIPTLYFIGIAVSIISWYLLWR
ncbi:MAG: hypothetical protein Q8P89_04080 [bacterium]|nr:hypothetical protein [bacterium]